jgi:ribosomal protein S18 acetylase RimI-like enzyme
MMEIRRGTHEDARLLCDLAEAVQEGHLAARPDFFKPHVVTPEMIAEFEAQLADTNTVVYIGEVGGEAIGYIVAQVMRRPESSYTYGLQYLYIDTMSVNAEHRSSGCGEQLMQTIFDLAKSLGMAKVILNVWAFNERAIAFYRRQGFKVRDLRMEADLE